mgnify:CR=1 FL=1
MAANPEYNPSGVGDCIDTNKLPWIPIPNAPGMSIKPARASGESGIFSLIFKLEAGSSLPASVYLAEWICLFCLERQNICKKDLRVFLTQELGASYVPIPRLTLSWRLKIQKF